jgi:uncharacterized protein (DUF305 family)
MQQHGQNLIIALKIKKMQHRKIKILFFVLASILFTACKNTNADMLGNGTNTLSNGEEDKYSLGGDKMQMSNITMELIKGTTEKIKNIKITGDIDIDFAHTMIIHHQSGIGFSEAEIENSTNVQIKKIAQGIITAQKKEIEKMTNFLTGYMLTNGKVKIAESKGKLSEIMIGMVTAINKMKMTWIADKDFAVIMIHHHESAVEMAREELLHGKEKMLRQVAAKMIDNKSKEMRMLKLWVIANGVDVLNKEKKNNTNTVLFI